MSQKEQDIEKKTFSGIVSNFLVKFRFLILGIIGALVVVAIGIGVWMSVTEANTKKGLTEVDALTYALTEAKASLSGSELSAKEDELFAKAKVIAESNAQNIIGVRSFMLMAEIKFAGGNWADARDAWLKAADAVKTAYTSSLCYYQAAVCSEELSDFDNAVNYLKVAAEDESFPVRTRAYFNIGRIEEQRGNVTAAAESYQSLVEKFPSDQWALLAKSRLLQLSVDGKVN